jgi:hypothetical protein
MSWAVDSEKCCESKDMIRSVVHPACRILFVQIIPYSSGEVNIRTLYFTSVERKCERRGEEGRGWSLGELATYFFFAVANHDSSNPRVVLLLREARSGGQSLE